MRYHNKPPRNKPETCTLGGLKYNRVTVPGKSTLYVEVGLTNLSLTQGKLKTIKPYKIFFFSTNKINKSVDC